MNYIAFYFDSTEDVGFWVVRFFDRLTQGQDWLRDNGSKITEHYKSGVAKVNSYGVLAKSVSVDFRPVT